MDLFSLEAELLIDLVAGDKVVVKVLQKKLQEEINFVYYLKGPIYQMNDVQNQQLFSYKANKQKFQFKVNQEIEQSKKIQISSIKIANYDPNDSSINIDLDNDGYIEEG